MNWRNEMNRKTWVILTILVAMTWPVLVTTAQTRQLPFDSAQTRRELEIMKGILETTLRFSVESVEADYRFPGSQGNVDGFYLYGQGAVFIVPIYRDPVRTAELASLEGSVAQLKAQDQASEAYLRAMEMRLDANRVLYEGMLQRDLAYVALPPVLAPRVPRPGSPPEAPEPPLPPPAPLPEAELVTDEALRERVADLEARLQDKKKQAEERQAEETRRLEILGVELIGAVAKHGQSLSVVKADEYITLLLTPGHSGLVRWGDRGSRSRTRVLTIPRSAITAFQSSGNLEQLQRSVIDYEL